MMDREQWQRGIELVRVYRDLALDARDTSEDDRVRLLNKAEQLAEAIGVKSGFIWSVKQEFEIESMDEKGDAACRPTALN